MARITWNLIQLTVLITLISMISCKEEDIGIAERSLNALQTSWRSTVGGISGAFGGGVSGAVVGGLTAGTAVVMIGTLGVVCAPATVTAVLATSTPAFASASSMILTTISSSGMVATATSASLLGAKLGTLVGSSFGGFSGLYYGYYSEDTLSAIEHGLEEGSINGAKSAFVVTVTQLPSIFEETSIDLTNVQASSNKIDQAPSPQIAEQSKLLDQSMEVSVEIRGWNQVQGNIPLKEEIQKSMENLYDLRTQEGITDNWLNRNYISIALKKSDFVVWTRAKSKDLLGAILGRFEGINNGVQTVSLDVVLASKGMGRKVVELLTKGQFNEFTEIKIQNGVKFIRYELEALPNVVDFYKKLGFQEIYGGSQAGGLTPMFLTVPV